MSKKITDMTVVSADDLIKIEGREGVSIFIVRAIGKSVSLGNCIDCIDHTAKLHSWYQVELINKGAELISDLELVSLFTQTQKELRKYELKAIEEAQREDHGMS